MLVALQQRALAEEIARGEILEHCLHPISKTPVQDQNPGFRCWLLPGFTAWALQNPVSVIARRPGFVRESIAVVTFA